MLVTEECPNCNSRNIDWGWDLHYIPGEDPEAVGQEGQCMNCNHEIYVTFRAVEVRVTDVNEFGDRLSEKVINV